MSLTHHPSDATLIAYAAGALREAPALVVASHLTFCGDCRRIVGIAETVGGVLLAGLPPAPLASDRFAETLSRLDAPSAGEVMRPAGPGAPWWPEPLRGYRLRRWRWIGPGISQIVVVRRAREGSSGRLLRLAPGRALPYHGHRGIELACVLRGSFSDETSRYAVGDCLEVDAGVRHRPLADPDDGCVCLVATSGPLDLGGTIGRLVQAILGL